MSLPVIALKHIAHKKKIVCPRAREGEEYVLAATFEAAY
jgi:hypothetical protein